ncbi:Dimethylaniline monooxygenase [N-oxide-forming] 5, partial [Paramuricea clavata]
MAEQNVAIIGCGASGLTSIKSCLDAGLKPVCFEQQSTFGGAWNYTDEPRQNLASVHKSTVTNTSKLVTGFSDFPMPKEFPNYLPQRLVREYFEMYGKEFDLAKYVEFNTEVVKLERSADHGDTGKWVVSTRILDSTNSEITTKTFDAVMICNGRYWDLAKPNIPGMEKFKGVIVHSGDYRTFHPYVGKRVVVVGCSHSAVDIAVELSHHAAQVYISTRSGCYVFTRLGRGGQPLDFSISRATQLIPLAILAKLLPGLVNNKVDFRNFGLQPTGTLGVNKFPIVNDEIQHRIITGMLKVKGNVKEIAENSVTLQGGETLDNIDALVLATGFKLKYSFAKDIIEVKDDFYTSLYKHIFLPGDKWHTLAVIGAVVVDASTAAASEMQARVAAEVFAGRCSLPSKGEMEKEIAKREQRWLKTGVSKYNFTR